ncbi:MAG: hypothetical protein IJD11_03365 [Oscillospiraceae bacterium]|nr:hypothetical protein [Oscillospiraceae bacterium]
MQQINLNGEWKIRWCDGQRGGMPHYIHVPGEPTHADVVGLEKEIADNYDPCKWIDAHVPGEIHQDLVKAGLIAPLYEGTGVLSSRWVEECMWFYRRVFDAPKEALSGLAQLTFENLDYGAIIYLNGKEIGRHENAFYPCRINVSGMLKESGNVLLVRLESGLYSACEKPIRDYFTATMTVDTLLHKRNWLRKTQSQMEWDWAPRLMNVGIGGDVSLQYHEAVIVDSIALNTELNEALDRGKLRCRVFSTLHDKATENIDLTVTVAGKEYTAHFDKMPEDGTLTAELTVDQPKLWWPIGYGDPSLYEVTVVLKVDGKEIARKVRKVGFRHVVVNQKPHPEEGNYFIFEINGQPVFMRGANLVPNDILNVAMTPDRYEKLVSLAIGANFNFLRIWGGGVYESDALYEICDSRGIMLWQEFIAACAVVPIEDKVLLESFKKEAVHQTRRISGHPCLVAWCGNNEIGWAQKGPFHAGEDDPLYEEILPSIVKAEDPEKYYQPTSPYSFIGQDHGSFIVGDQHPWAVGFENKDSREYETMNCRFPNEGGILGPTSVDTVKACLRPGEGMHSLSWQVHDNMLENWLPGSSADDDVRFWTDINPRDLSLEEYVYLGGFVQGDGFKRYIDNFRRRKYDSSSAVFWMYNDCWPTVRSWTIVDYYMRKNPSYHPVRRAFEPITVVIANESDGYRLYGVNDTLKEWKGKVTYGIFDVDGTMLQEKSEAVTFAPNASTPITIISDVTIAPTQIVYACLYNEDGDLVAKTRYTAQKYQDLGLLPAEITVEKTEGGYLLKSDRFVMGVCLDLNGTDRYADNFFDLFPNQPYFVPTDTDEELQILNYLNRFFN